MTRALIVVLALIAAQPVQPRESLVRKLLRITGLTAAPSQMRAPENGEPGSIWIADIDRGTTKQVTEGQEYRSPLFSPTGPYLYAAKGGTVVRLDSNGTHEVVVGRVPNLEKLVGFDAHAPDDLVLLLDLERNSSPFAVLSIKTGRLTPLPFDPGSPEENEMLTQIRSSERVYGDTRLYTKTESRAGLARKIEWTDVYLARSRAAPVNVSSCDGVSCADPALSTDGRRVVFIKRGA